MVKKKNPESGFYNKKVIYGVLAVVVLVIAVFGVWKLLQGKSAVAGQATAAEYTGMTAAFSNFMFAVQEGDKDDASKYNEKFDKIYDGTGEHTSQDVKDSYYDTDKFMNYAVAAMHSSDGTYKGYTAEFWLQAAEKSFIGLKKDMHNESD